VSDAKNAVIEVAKQGRKSVNKAIDRIDAANIPLPESPITVNKISDAATNVVDNVLALAPTSTHNFSKELQTRFHGVSNVLVKYGGQSQHRVESYVRVLRDYLSYPEHLITSAIAFELLFLLRHVVQFYEHTLFFPPVGGAKGSFYSLLHSLFGWAPRTSLTLTLPEFRSIYTGDFWAAFSWWFFATVLPPLALSTVVSFGPQKGAHRGTGRHATHSQHPKPDPLAFTIFRFFALLFPLTTAAPSSVVDALEMSGNIQGRALGAGLLAALMLADRLGGVA